MYTTRKTQIQSITKLQQSLVEKLDRIDHSTANKIADGYYQSRLAIKLGAWHKGKAISFFLGRVKKTLSFTELAEITGRSRSAVRQWLKLYQKHPNFAEYKKLAERQAEQWTKKALKKIEGRVSSDSDKVISPKQLKASITRHLHGLRDDLFDYIEEYRCEVDPEMAEQLLNLSKWLKTLVPQKFGGVVQDAEFEPRR